MIETYLLRGLAAIDETGSFTAAAAALHVSQPALSRAMQKLEGELGVALFERGSGRTVLGPLGRLAAGHARLALAAIDGLSAAVREADRARRVFRYGTIAPAPVWTLDPILGKLFPDRKAGPDIRETEDELLAGLADGTFEMAVLLRTPPGKDWHGRPFLREHLGVLLPEGHRLARRKTLRFADLAGETFVLHGTIGFWMPLSREKIPRARFFRQETLEALRSIVESVALPSFYTDLSLDAVPIPPGKAAIPLRDPEASATYHLVCRADRAPSLAPLFAALPAL